ncbi:MAG TPA: hypothetical protein VGN80_09630 [Devosiaceae bacterium]|jgi:hypothetical protein|nr:hypothetical protein [Devosiaceae bacterium]
MSHDAGLRRQVQEQIRQTPNMEKVQPHQTGNDHDARVINNEIDRQREQQGR